MLLFADDVLLLALSRATLSAIYIAFRSFCTAHRLTISKPKAKAMVARDASVGNSIDLAGDVYEVVSTFRYLGVMLDSTGGTAPILGHIATSAARGFGGLCDFLGVHGWSTVWTRLVLYDVYVRTHLTFACATWAPYYLEMGHLESRDSQFGKLANQYRRGLRILTGMRPEVRVEVLHVAVLRWPLEVAVAKATWRYYK